MVKPSDEAEEHIREIVTLMNATPEEQEAYWQALPPDGTSTKLVMDLMEKPPTPERDEIIRLAKEFFYDDFKSTYEGMCPKVKLVDDLTKAGFVDLAGKTMSGEYD